jgi:PAS domain S-box-containing protein
VLLLWHQQQNRPELPLRSYMATEAARKIAPATLSSARIATELYREIFRESIDGIAVIDANGFYIEQNDAHRELTGFSDADLHGRTPAIHLGETAFGEIAAELQRTGRYRGKVISQPKTGPQKKLELTAFAVRDKLGQPICFVGIKRDITERDQIEAERAARLRELESVCSLACGLNRASKVAQIYNAAIEALLASIKADRASILIYDADNLMHFKAWHGLSDEYRAAVDGHSPWKPDAIQPAPVVVNDAAADSAWAAYLPTFQREGIAALAFVPICYEGRLLGKFMVYFNKPHVFTTDELRVAEALAAHVAVAINRRRAEEALWRSEKLAAAGRVAATVAHEINNPLEAITNLAFLVRNAVSDRPEAVRLLDQMDEELHRVAFITKQTLGFYRDSSKPVPFDVAELVSGIIAMYRPKLEQGRIQVDVNAPQPAKVVGLPGEVRQVISNVFANALDALNGHGGHIRIDVASDPERVSVTVADNGRGIPDTVLPRIFEPFFTTKQDVGTGLGLAVCKQIVDRCGGSVHVESSASPERHGTVFRVCFPRDMHA